MPDLSLTPAEADQRFAELQKELVPLGKSIESFNQDEQTVIVVPSVTVEIELLGSEMQAYEERFLFLLLLRQPRLRLICVTSQAPDAGHSGQAVARRGQATVAGDESNAYPLLLMAEQAGRPADGARRGSVGSAGSRGGAPRDDEAFAAACDRADVPAEDRPALLRLYHDWPWAAADAGAWLEELIADHAEWQLFARSRHDEEAAHRFHARWAAYARAALSWRLQPDQVEEQVSAFFERLYRLVGPRYGWKSPFRVYLRTVLVNISRTHGRRLQARRDRELPLEDNEPGLGRRLASRDPSPEHRLLARERGAALERAFLALTPLDRHLVQAALVDGEPVADIGARLGIGREALYKRIQRARQRLRRQLDRDGLLSED